MHFSRLRRRDGKGRPVNAEEAKAIEEIDAFLTWAKATGWDMRMNTDAFRSFPVTAKIAGDGMKVN